MGEHVLYYLPTAILIGYASLLLAAAAYDVARFRIPNWLTAALAGLFLTAAIFALPETDWTSHLAAGLGVLAVGAAIFHLGWLGGGDVKLLAVGSLWLGLENLVLYLIAVSVIGGGLAVGLLFVRRILRRGLARRAPSGVASLPRVLRRGEAIPYGVAIAAGAVLLGGASPLLAAAHLL